MDIDISKISSFQELKKVCNQIEKAENSIKDEINEFYNQKASLTDDMVKLESSIPNLESIENHTNTLSKMMIFAAELADNVSMKVRQLDLAKNRVHQCICRVEDILDLKACTDGVQKALSEENYETASGFIKRFLDMDENMLRLTEEEAEHSLKVLHSSAKQLKDISIKSFDHAIEIDDFKSIDKFLKIFPLIGERQLGLEKFGCYLNGKINTEMKGQIKLADLSDHERYLVKFVDLMTSLIETVAELIKKYQPYVESYYGNGYLYILLGILQKECDTWALTIIDKFKRERTFSQYIGKVKHSLSNTAKHNYYDNDDSDTGKSVSTADRLDPMELEVLITEIALMNSRVELYLRFLRRKIQVDMEMSNMKNETKITEECNRFFSNLNILNEMQSLINNYILLEEYFLKEMVLKAMNTQEIEEKNNSSKIVDAVFFVVNKCVKRTLSSGNVEGMCAMLNLTSTILIEEYVNNTLKDRLKNQYNLSNTSTAWMRDAYTYMHTGVAGSSGQLGAMATVNSASSIAGLGNTSNMSSINRQKMFTIYLNTAELSIECVETLRSSLTKEMEQMFSKTDKVSMSKLSECLVAMSSSIADKLRELVDQSIGELTINIIKPQIKSFTQQLSAMKHMLTEEEFLTFEANDPWVEQFLINVQTMLSDFNETMIPGIYEKLIQKFCEETVYRIEKIVKTKSFNKLGGIQLDRDIRTLINFFCTTTQWGVREKFTRLRQIANILNLENVTEISSYWDQMTWRLNPSEIRQYMALRSDFRTDEIRKLVLL